MFLPNTFTQTIPRDTNAQGIADMLVGFGGGALSCYILIPTWANVLASEGWTKKKLIEYVAQNSKSPLAQPGRPTLNPDDLMVVVAGGPGAFSAHLRSAGGSMMGSGFVTKKIELPKNWDKLVAKYKNLVPAYLRY
jgi:hypothetical protein